MALFVIRHGESTWNKENKFTGWTNDVPLSEKGKQEARDAGALLRDKEFASFFVSPFVRTRQTLENIQHGLQKSEQRSPESIHSDQALVERDYGDLTGKNKSELRTEYGDEVVRKWRRGYLDRPPNGENLHDVCVRVGKYYDNNIAPSLANGNALLVSHGNTIRALFVHLGIHDSTSVEDLEIPTGIPIVIHSDKSFTLINKYNLLPYQIIDSRGFPTIEIKCYDTITNMCVGKGSCPSGASCGSNEVLEVRDKISSLYHGKSVFSAVEKIANIKNKLHLNDKTCRSLENIDNQLVALDKSPLKSEIGGNVATAISFCMADVAANLNNMELYEYLANQNNIDIATTSMPTPLVNIINGGKHSVTGELMIQEFMIFANEKYDTKMQTRLVCEVYHSLKSLLAKKYGASAKSIGDEGGFCPPIYNADEALNVIEQACADSNYVVGEDVFIALDCAASEFYDQEKHTYEVEKGMHLTGSELVDYYEKLMEKHPALKSIEDAFDEKDYESWKLFTEKFGGKMMIVGDDLFTTNPSLIEQGLREKWANTLLLKVNQIGTVSEAIRGAQMLFQQDNDVIVSHRSGETNHAMLVDIAVGIGAKYVKIGSPCRGERVAKFNRLLEIFEELQYKA